MQKPVKRHVRTAYVYQECRDFLQHRDGYDERDYAGKYDPDTLSGDYARIPYQDFWHFVLSREPSLANGSLFTMCEAWKKDAEPWQRAILDKYLDAFGTPDATGARTIDFSVAW